MKIYNYNKLRTTIRVLSGIGSFYLTFYLFNLLCNWYHNSYFIFSNGILIYPSWYVLPTIVLGIIFYILLMFGLNIYIWGITEN